MKYLLIASLAVALASCSPNETVGPDCPPPQRGIEGPLLPHEVYAGPTSSTDGKRIAFFEYQTANAYIWDKPSGRIELIDLEELEQVLPIKFRFINQCFFSSLDPDKLMFACTDYLDTGGGRSIIRNNIFFYEISSRSLNRITPSTEGEWGLTNLYILNWRANMDRDSISIWGQGIYCPQLDTFLTTTTPAEEYYHRSGKKVVVDRSDLIRVMYNNLEFSVPDSEFRLEDVSWSPNGDRVALSVARHDVAASASLREVWVYSLESGKPEFDSRIDLWRRYCMFSFVACEAEFATDSSLVLSMHSDGDAVSALWEVSLPSLSVSKVFQ